MLTESVKSLLGVQFLMALIVLILLTLLLLLLVVAEVWVHLAGLLVRCISISTRVSDRSCLVTRHAWLVVLHLMRMIVAIVSHVYFLIRLWWIVLVWRLVRFTVLVANIASIFNKVGVLESLPGSAAG